MPRMPWVQGLQCFAQLQSVHSDTVCPFKTEDSKQVVGTERGGPDPKKEPGGGKDGQASTCTLLQEASIVNREF